MDAVNLGMGVYSDSHEQRGQKQLPRVRAAPQRVTCRTKYHAHAASGNFLQQLVVAEVMNFHTNGGGGSGQQR